MKVKSKLAIVALFSCCAVMSMGFANWVITQEGPIKDIAEGGISADSIIYSNDYISLDTTRGNDYDGEVDGIDRLICGKTNLRYDGNLTLYFKTDVEKCYDLFGNANFSFVVTMKFADNVSLSNENNIFYLSYRNSSVIQPSVSADEEFSSMLINTRQSTTDSSYTVTQTLNVGNFYRQTEKVEYAYFQVTFKFTVSSTEYQSYFLDPFFNDGARFVFEVSIQ